jgi:hypothetical protein
MAARTQIASNGDSWYTVLQGGSSTDIVLPITGDRTIQADSLVIVGWCYDSTTAVFSAITDSTGETAWVTVESGNGTNVIGMAYCFKHKGGASSITITLSSAKTYRGIASVEFSGSGASTPIDVAPTVDTDWDQTLMATGDGLAVLVGCAYAGTAFTASSAGVQAQRGETGFGICTYKYTGSGSKNIAATGASGATRSYAALFLDTPAPAGPSIPVLSQTYRRR